MPRAFVFANGDMDLPGDLRSLVHPEDIIICADGGANCLAQTELLPHIIIGDMDSIDNALLNHYENLGVQICRYQKEKDQSDLELALAEAVKVKPQELICLGVLGGRLDHFLTNILLLGHFVAQQKIRVSILGFASCAQFVTNNQPAIFQGKPKDVISLMPLTPVVHEVTTEGTKWTLNKTSLHWGSSLTLSNEFSSDTVKISLTEGLLLTVHTWS